LNNSNIAPFLLAMIMVNLGPQSPSDDGETQQALFTPWPPRVNEMKVREPRTYLLL
jgi:hypothetical protein